MNQILWGKLKSSLVDIEQVIKEDKMQTEEQKQLVYDALVKEYTRAVCNYTDVREQTIGWGKKGDKLNMQAYQRVIRAYTEMFKVPKPVKSCAPFDPPALWTCADDGCNGAVGTLLYNARQQARKNMIDHGTPFTVP